MNQTIPWPKGSMIFIQNELVKFGSKSKIIVVDKPRKWTSKLNETPDVFLMRIIRDMDKKAPAISDYFMKEFLKYKKENE